MPKTWMRQWNWISMLCVAILMFVSCIECLMVGWLLAWLAVSSAGCDQNNLSWREVLPRWGVRPFVTARIWPVCTTHSSGPPGDHIIRLSAASPVHREPTEVNNKNQFAWKRGTRISMTRGWSWVTTEREYGSPRPEWSAAVWADAVITPAAR